MRRLSALFLFAAVSLLPAFGAETVLIIPFFNISSARNIDWIGDSISETIQESLASQGVLTVKQELRDQILVEQGVKRYARLTRASVMEVAVNLDATTVLYGEIQLSPAVQGAVSRGRLTITARLVNVRQLRRGPEFVETGPLEELSNLQTRVAWRVLRSVLPESTLTEERFREQHPPIRVDALENYIRGLLAPSPDQKLKLFAQAARLEPSFTRASFQMGHLYFDRKEYRNAAEWLLKVTPADSSYREAQFLLGVSRYFLSDFNGAIAILGKLAEAVPLGEVENNLGAAQLRVSRPEAFSHFLKAIEVDPADPIYQFNAGYAFWRLGNFPRAAEHFRATLERVPDDEMARTLLDRASRQVAHRPGDPATENLARIKLSYDESAWVHLKAMFGGKQNPQ